MSHIFISYSREDQTFAKRLAEDIRHQGFDVWIDDRIDFGDRWFDEIEQAIFSCAAFVVIMSPQARKSRWVQREVLIAERDNKPTFPLLLNGRVFGNLIDLQYTDVRGGALPQADFYQRLSTEVKPARSTGNWVVPGERTPDIIAESEQSRRPLWALGVVLVLLVIGAVVGALMLGDDGDARSLVQAATDTEEPPTATATDTVTSSPTATDTDTPTDTVTPSPTATDTPTDTVTPSPTPTNTLTPTATDTPTPAASDTPTPIPAIEVAMAGVGSNAAWTPYFQAFDGYRMALVPSGCVRMGSVRGGSDEYPVTEVCFDSPFWIDSTEVTNAQYGSFGAFRGQNRPRESVSWFEAAAFCASRGGRLPSEAEWEYAAKGPDDLPFPWGSTFDSLLVIDGQDPEGSTADVGTRPDGGSWVGALDMSGNVWEWTGSIYHSYPYDPNDGREDTEPSNQDRPVVRGGSWISAQEKLTTTYRERSLPTYRDNLIGFRCVLDFVP